jgi:hypothetical protein
MNTQPPVAIPPRQGHQSRRNWTQVLVILDLDLDWGRFPLLKTLLQNLLSPLSKTHLKKTSEIG